MLNKELFILGLLENKGDITEREVEKFKKYYLEILNEGYYIVRNKNGNLNLSCKFIEKNIKALLNYDEDIKKIFYEVK